MRPDTLLGIAEVNDVEKLNSRKNWIVGALEPFSRSKAAEKEWKAVTHALFGDQNFAQLDFKANYFIRGNAVPFPTEAFVKRAGGSATDEVRLLVLCPERGKNGWPNWVATTEELMKEEMFDEVFQSGQLMPDAATKSGTSRWPYTAAAVIFTETTGASQKPPGKSAGPGSTEKVGGSSKRKLHIVNILFDTTKLPMDKGTQIAEGLYQILHGFLAFAARGADQPGSPGDQNRPVKAGGEPKPETQTGKAASRIQVDLPEFLVSGSWPEEWRREMRIAVDALGFVKGNFGWVHQLKACSQCGAWDRKVQACSACSRVKYCSQACQRAAWNNGHKQECKEFRASKESSEAS
ncbi:hypothetical protein KFL_000260310 [Klebsormidium nitens]|uniref:MYND-type domain-containing protein n=1 Tax=Klebsormidium nitens TaxID=105231 RepID=A0A1Y1HKS9_KLENI|nr:hypothetical protein KFL_000260310 [Klebsormidium nitens]|eukprot:GAQ79214.1 hypothetical protein KFL_000260310 [Klebsormidium nitens]